MPPRAEVVVIGAGLAGLSTATRLAAAGRGVHVVEAAGHVGGRLTTDRVDGFLVDRGLPRAGRPMRPRTKLRQSRSR
jgi:phytoene dehydrogenase-like protein